MLNHNAVLLLTAACSSWGDASDWSWGAKCLNDDCFWDLEVTIWVLVVVKIVYVRIVNTIVTVSKTIQIRREEMKKMAPAVKVGRQNTIHHSTPLSPSLSLPPSRHHCLLHARSAQALDLCALNPKPETTYPEP